MSDEKAGFTVTDRRHFAPDGKPRPEGDPTPVAEPPRDAIDFVQFVVSLAAQASVLLRAPTAEPSETLPPPDREGARQIISILEMLKDKTEGRRTPEEERVLEEILFQLRLAYVARERGPA
jgi:hypothetical protein